MRLLRKHSSVVTGVAFNPTSNQVATCSADGSIRLWDMGTGKQVNSLVGHPTIVAGLAYMDDGNQVISLAPDLSCYVWDSKSGRRIGHARLKPDKDRGATVNHVAISPDGSMVAAAYSDRRVVIWDAKTTKQIGVQRCSSLMCFSSDSLAVASVCNDEVVAWQVRTNIHIVSLSVTSPVLAMAVSPQAR
eukprot:gene31397-6560_t